MLTQQNSFCAQHTNRGAAGTRDRHDRLGLPLALAGVPFTAREIFDGDRVLDYEIEKGELPG